MLGRNARVLLFAALFGSGLCGPFAEPAVRAQEPGDGPPARVLFLMPELGKAQEATLKDALYAQLSLVGAELVLRDDPADRDAKQLAQAEQARIVLWLDTSAGDRWLVHIMDVQQERAVVRRIDARTSQQGAAIEAIAVLAREASRGGPLPEAPAEEAAELAPTDRAAQPRQPEAAPEPQQEASPSPADPGSEDGAGDADAPPPRLRLAAYYSGVDFARETSFNHGVGLSVRLDWADGFFAGAQAGWAALAKPPGNLAIQRIPLGAGVGYRIRLLPELWADLEVGVLIDLLTRTTRGGGTGQSDSLRVATSLAPRLRGEYRPAQFIGLFAGFGLDLVFWALRYESQTTPRQVLLSPNRVRPALEAGIAFYP